MKNNNLTIETASKLASKIGAQKNIEVEFTPIKGADHFYRNKIEEGNNEKEIYNVRSSQVNKATNNECGNLLTQL